MVETSPCPEVGVIQRFLLGQIPEADAGSVVEHLSHCGNCMNSAISLSSPDVVTELIQSRSRSERSGHPNPAADEAMDQTSPAPNPHGPGDDEHFLLPPQAPDEIGRMGPYRVLKLLGEGGMGVVYLAEDPQLARSVALKVMKPSAASAEEARKRFLREARATAAIEHDYIVTIYQVGEDSGVPYLAMQLLQGESLHDRLKAQSRLPLVDALWIARQVAEGLAAAHERGLIHRDVKPSNIWLEAGRNRIKLLDFGLARQAGTDPELTHSGVILGTPAYMAPEQAGGDMIDSRCDLFSLGCVIYRMCAGDLPFKGANSLAILRALAVETPRPLHEANPEVPIALSLLVGRMLSKHPDDRPPSASAVVQTIEVIERTAPAPSQLGSTSFLKALETAHLDELAPLESQFLQRPPAGKPATTGAGASQTGMTPYPGSSLSAQTPQPGASQSSKSPSPGASQSGKRRGPGGSHTGKSPGASGSHTGKSPGAGGSGTTKSPDASEAQKGRSANSDKGARPETPAWEDLPVLPSRSRTMRRLYRREYQEWVPIALGAGLLTAVVIGLVIIIRLIFAR